MCVKTSLLHRSKQRRKGNVPLREIAAFKARFDQRARNVKLGYEDEILITEILVSQNDSSVESERLLNLKFS